MTGTVQHQPSATPHTRTRAPYEPLLRSLGRYLDEASARSVRCIELQDRYAVQFHDRAGEHSSTTVYLSLRDLEPARVRFRVPRQLMHGLHVSRDVSYEDLLRAVGYELDQVRGATVLLEELDEGFILTYQYLNPVDGYMLRKRIVRLDEEARNILIHAARSRRKKR